MDPLWLTILEALSYLTVVISLPLALYQYRRKTLKEQADREYGTYNALDEKYLEFLSLCFNSPELDIFDIPDASPQALDTVGHKRELIAYTMLISILERAYLMYHDQSDHVRARQWDGWLEYVREYCKRRNFQEAWAVAGESFDSHFCEFMAREIARGTTNAPS